MKQGYATELMFLGCSRPVLALNRHEFFEIVDFFYLSSIKGGRLCPAAESNQRSMIFNATILIEIVSDADASAASSVAVSTALMAAALMLRLF